VLGTQMYGQVSCGAKSSILAAVVARLPEPIVQMRLLILTYDLLPVVVDSQVLLVGRNVDETSLSWTQETLKKFFPAILVIANMSHLVGERLIGPVQVLRDEVVQALVFAADMRGIGMQCVDGSMWALDATVFSIHHEPPSAQLCQLRTVVLVS